MKIIVIGVVILLSCIGYYFFMERVNLSEKDLEPFYLMILNDRMEYINNKISETESYYIEKCKPYLNEIQSNESKLEVCRQRKSELIQECEKLKAKNINKKVLKYNNVHNTNEKYLKNKINTLSTKLSFYKNELESARAAKLRLEQNYNNNISYTKFNKRKNQYETHYKKSMQWVDYQAELGRIESRINDSLEQINKISKDLHNAKNNLIKTQQYIMHNNNINNNINNANNAILNKIKIEEQNEQYLLNKIEYNKAKLTEIENDLQKYKNEHKLVIDKQKKIAFIHTHIIRITINSDKNMKQIAQLCKEQNIKNFDNFLLILSQKQPKNYEIFTNKRFKYNLTNELHKINASIINNGTYIKFEDLNDVDLVYSLIKSKYQVKK